MKQSADPILNVMRARGIPVTRKNYLDLNYMGRPPKELHPEAEQELPDELRGPDDIIAGSIRLTRCWPTTRCVPIPRWTSIEF